MTRSGLFSCVIPILSLVLARDASSEVMIGVVPSDGTTSFVKRFPIAAGSTIQGVTFRNNDPATVFPEVLIARGVDASLADGVIAARALAVRETSPGWVQVIWEQPVHVVEATDYYVAVRIPSGPGKQGPGSGPALGAVEVEEPVGSFVAGGAEGDLTALRLDLSIDLLFRRSFQTDISARRGLGSGVTLCGSAIACL